jgi:secondary thiamine-phosphate synthase enzyme
MVRTIELALQTKGHTDILDITDEVARAVGASGLKEGVATVFTPSSTSSLTTLEYEPGAIADLKRALDEIAPPNREYQHNLKWGDGNGVAHLRAALVGSSVTVPVVNGQLGLGTWQQIIFLDFDTRPRRRTLVVQCVGE